MQKIVGRLIMEEARTLRNVRFSHQGRKNGLDCLGLIIAVANGLKLRDKHERLLASHDRLDYTKSPKSNILCNSLEAALLHIPTDEMKAGDILLFQMDQNPQHLAIVTDYDATTPGIIHAYAPARKVVEHALDISWRKRIIACYRIPASRQPHLILQ